jgi:hypothetical protein
MDDISIDQDI